MFPDEFPDSFSHYAWTAAQSVHSDFVGSEVYACLGVTCHLHFWQNDRDLLRAIVLTRGWNGHRVRVSIQSLTLEKKISPAASAGRSHLKVYNFHCSNTVVEQTLNKSQHTKLTLEKKILPPLLLGFELTTFRSRVRRSNQQAIPALCGDQ